MNVVKLDAAIPDLRGRPIAEQFKDGTVETVTVRSVLVGALLNSADTGDQDIAEKQRRFRLANKIQNNGAEYTLWADDIVLLKHVVGITFSTLIVGRILDILEPQKPAASDVD
jgi:hypothetical protein